LRPSEDHYVAANLAVVACVVAVSVVVLLINDRYRATLPPEEEAAVRARDRRTCIVMGCVLGSIVAFGAVLDLLDRWS
jgi:hypothetical protein